MGIKQMMACVLAEIRTNQEHLKEEMRDSQEQLREEMRAGQEHVKEEMRAGQELWTEENAHRERMMARMYSQLV
jgi:gas vesicle protein